MNQLLFLELMSNQLSTEKPELKLLRHAVRSTCFRLRGQEIVGCYKCIRGNPSPVIVYPVLVGLWYIIIHWSARESYWHIVRNKGAHVK